MQPEVKQAGKQKIQAKAEESILDFLHRANRTAPSGRKTGKSNSSENRI